MARTEKLLWQKISVSMASSYNRNQQHDESILRLDADDNDSSRVELLKAKPGKKPKVTKEEFLEMQR